MIDVFISRPTWVAEEFKQGLSGFLAFLETHELKPRSLGSTDYGTESPFNDVLSIMDDCKGVVVLGYPQIYVTKCKIKEEDINNLLLPTEWNHIEATLAFVKKLPLLVIHHEGITRGIFERGALSKYIYEKNLSEVNWFLSENIKGALMKWKALINKSQQNVSPTNPPPIVPVSSNIKLEKNVESVLVYFFSLSSNTGRNAGSIKTHFKCNSQVAQYYLDVLREKEMIEPVRKNTYNVWFYTITSKGRDYVMTNNLIPLKMSTSLISLLPHIS